jgi:ABC-type branched-subunit amino acid transport system permease subunit
LEATIAVVVTELIGVANGLIALHSRHVDPATATMALAPVSQDTILNTSARTGGLNGTNIRQFILGVDPTGSTTRSATPSPASSCSPGWLWPTCRDAGSDFN